MKNSELIEAAKKGPIVIGPYISGKPDQITSKGRVFNLERHWLLVDGEPKEFGRMLDQGDKPTVGTIKPGELAVAQLKLRADPQSPRAFRISATVEALAA